MIMVCTGSRCRLHPFIMIDESVCSSSKRNSSLLLFMINTVKTDDWSSQGMVEDGSQNATHNQCRCVGRPTITSPGTAGDPYLRLQANSYAQTEENLKRLWMSHHQNTARLSGFPGPRDRDRSVRMWTTTDLFWDGGLWPIPTCFQ